METEYLYYRKNNQWFSLHPYFSKFYPNFKNMKVRIKKRNNVYYCQYRWFFIWRNFKNGTLNVWYQYKKPAMKWIENFKKNGVAE